MSDAKLVAPARTLRGSLRVPGDKSASHRALMLSALADGQSTIVGLSWGQDVRATSMIVEHLGANCSFVAGHVVVEGPSAGLRASGSPLDCGNSGTTMRLMAGIVSGVAGSHVLVGDASLSKRPMDRVATPLRLMGAKVSGQGDHLTAPLSIEGQAALRAIEYHVPVPSAQVKSAVLFAGLQATGHTVVSENVRTRSTTETMMRHAGLTLHSVDQGEGRAVTLTPGRPAPTSWHIPGDPSQAAFFAVLGAIHSDASIDVVDIDNAPERVGFVAVLRRMGAILTWHDVDAATLHSESAALIGTEVFAREIPSVDEVPVLTVAAAAAKGLSVFRDMSELRVKESDRFAGSMALAKALGCRVWSEGDDFFVEGLGSARAFQSFSLAGGLDHRMVMAGAVAALAGNGGTIEGAATVESSYPEFFNDVDALQ